MNKYAIQSYFNSLCDTNFIAYEELRRIKERIAYNEAKKQKGLKVDPDEKMDLTEINIWNQIINKYMELIEIAIDTIALDNIKIIVTSRKVVLALILYYSFEGFIDDGYKIINTDEEFLSVFPQDPLSQRFLQAYKDENMNEMTNLYAMTYVKDVIF